MSVDLRSNYVLGSSRAEHGRLREQAKVLHAFTDRLLRDAGITRGQRVLDIGAGIGDVSLLLARMVGKQGAVCGIDNDAAALAKARARARAASLQNVRFLEQDLNHWELDGEYDAEYDAVAGRFVLMFLPAERRAQLMKCLCNALKPGGVAVFQEPSWQDYFANARHLRLHTLCGRLVCDALTRAGAEINMALPLYQHVTEAGLHTCTIRIDLPLAKPSDGQSWIADLFTSLKSSKQLNDVGCPELGPDLHRQLSHELLATRSFVPIVGLVGVIARTP